MAFWIVDSTAETLPLAHADLDLDHVEPAGVFRGVVELEAAQDAAGLGGGKGVVEDAGGMDRQVVLHDTDAGGAGHYLAFIYAYWHMFGRPPAEADLQRHFGVSPPSVHQMIVTLERNGLIRRQAGALRSIEILVPPENLPILSWLGIYPSKSL
jgi:hypothetical protein